MADAIARPPRERGHDRERGNSIIRAAPRARRSWAGTVGIGGQRAAFCGAFLGGYPAKPDGM